MENLLIPEGSAIRIHNVTETTMAFILSSADEDQKTFLIIENHFLLIDVTRCFDCRFRALIKSIATSYGKYCVRIHKLLESSTNLESQEFISTKTFLPVLTYYFFFLCICKLKRITVRAYF